MEENRAEEGGNRKYQQPYFTSVDFLEGMPLAVIILVIQY